MPRLYICSGHGGLVPYTKHGLCPACERTRQARRGEGEPWRWVYESPQWAKAKARALAEAGYQCELIDDDGERCDAVTKLEAHHIVPLRLGGEPFDAGNLVVLCRTHHGQVEAGLVRL